MRKQESIYGPVGYICRLKKGWVHVELRSVKVVMIVLMYVQMRTVQVVMQVATNEMLLMLMV